MRKATTLLLGLGLVGAGAYGAWTLGSGLLGEDDEATGTRHLVNQVWIERLPEGERDMIGHLVFVRHQRGRLGGVGKSSRWRHFVELFHWALEGDKVKVFFPQEEVRGALRARTWKCKGEAPRPFELCLELKSGRGSVTYYSMEDWQIDPDHVQASLEQLGADEPELAGVFDNAVEGDPGETVIDVESYTEADVLSRLPQ